MSCTRRFTAAFTGPAIVAAVLLGSTAAFAQQSTAAGQDSPPGARAAEVEQAQAAKAQALRPYEPGSAERVVGRLEDMFVNGRVHLHPFFESAYAGGGFTLGAGYAQHVSAYNTIDVRGSITPSGYKRIEAAFLAPRLFRRQGTLNVLGGWRDATQVAFYGIGTENTSAADRANYSFEQPYAAAALEVRPSHTQLVMLGGVEMSQWQQGPGSGAAPSVDEVYTPDTLPGLGSRVTYLHSHAGVGVDWRPSPGYARPAGPA